MLVSTSCTPVQPVVTGHQQQHVQYSGYIDLLMATMFLKGPAITQVSEKVCSFKTNSYSPTFVGKEHEQQPKTKFVVPAQPAIFYKLNDLFAVVSVSQNKYHHQ